MKPLGTYINSSKFDFDEDLFKRHLSTFLFKNLEGHAEIKIFSRQPLHHSGTFPSQILTCLINNETISLLCKYAVSNNSRKDAVEYEAMIYRDVVSQLPFSHIKYFGDYSISQSNSHDVCLVLEYLENGIQLKHVEPEIFSDAAEWIARFHQFYENKNPGSVRVLDEHHYMSLVDHTLSLVGNMNYQLQWFRDMCFYFRDNIYVLTETPQTVIHGEFYGKNILVKSDSIYAIDWETAAIGPAEIDLAALMDGKDERRIGFAIDSYKKTRWGKSEIPSTFSKRLLMANLYYQFHWIKDWQIGSVELENWMSDAGFFNRLYKLAQQPSIK